jgi:hypothetical protein
MKTKICNKCGVEKDLKEFHRRTKESTVYKTHCKACVKEYRKKYYAKHRQKFIDYAKISTQKQRELRREFLWEYLSSHPCIDCGEDDPLVLEFDHISGKKVAPVSQLISRGFSEKRIQEEIDKCEVRCSNCHKRKTAKEFGWYRKHS